MRDSAGAIEVGEPGAADGTLSQNTCRFRFQCGTGGVREINVLRKVSPATFSVSIETED